MESPERITTKVPSVAPCTLSVRTHARERALTPALGRYVRAVDIRARYHASTVKISTSCPLKVSRLHATAPSTPPTTPTLASVLTTTSAVRVPANHLSTVSTMIVASPACVAKTSAGHRGGKHVFHSTWDTTFPPCLLVVRKT